MIVTATARMIDLSQDVARNRSIPTAQCAWMSDTCQDAFVKVRKASAIARRIYLDTAPGERDRI
jgi:hypothetical protein